VTGPLRRFLQKEFVESIGLPCLNLSSLERLFIEWIVQFYLSPANSRRKATLRWVRDKSIKGGTDYLRSDRSL
jgi:hypothetical protein